MSDRGRFARCDGCSEQKMLYPENDYECASCHEETPNALPGEISELHSVLKARGWSSNLEPTVITGRMASGRTNMAFVLGDLWEHEGGSVASNVPSCQDATFAGTATELREWAARTSEPKLFIYDEGTMLLPVQNDARMRLLLNTLADLNLKPVFVLNSYPEWAKHSATKLTMMSKKTAVMGEGTVRNEFDDLPLTSFTYDLAGIPEWDWN